MQTISPAEQLAALPVREREIFLLGLTKQEINAMRWDWRFWARPQQLEPTGEWWSTWVALAGRGFGKALSLDTPLVTASGWTTMARVRVGETLFDECGVPCRVTAVHPVQIARPCYRVTFSDGNTIIADEDHLWSTLDREGRRKCARRGLSTESQRKVRTTKEISETLLSGTETNHCVPCVAPLQTSQADLLLEPYLLGCWLGDGATKAAAITTMDAEIVSSFEAEGYELRAGGVSGRSTTYSIQLSDSVLQRCGTTGRYLAKETGFLAKLRDLGVLGKKHIPAAYMRASEAQRRDLLQGLMDTGGTCEHNGNVAFCSALPGLADQVCELALSLGYKAVLGSRLAHLNGVCYGTAYIVSFMAHAEAPVFRLSRKRQRLNTKGAQAERAYRRYIKSVDRIDSVPVRCITVDSPSCLYLAGAGMVPTHNTRLGAEWVRDNVCGPTPLAPGRARRVALVAETAADGRDVMVAGPSGILAVHPPEFRPRYVKSERALHWPNGAIALVFSAEDPEQLRGPEHDLAWSDECAKWKYPQETWDMLQFGLRLGDHPRQLATTTPKPIPLVRALLEREGRDVAVTRGSTYDNASNLATGFLRQMRERYEGTRLGRQELRAELLDDVPGALWTRTMLQRRDPNIEELELSAGMGFQDTLPDMARIVVGVDPSGTSGEDDDASDSVGIVVAGLGVDGVYYVLEDATCELGPSGWARRVVDKYKEHEADVIVGERNFGGAMVEFTIRTIDRQVNYKEVSASRGKVLRAEPIAALYERGQVRHVGNLSDLEDQMCSLARSGYLGKKSPDRLDAMVWAVTELMVGRDDYDPEIYAALAD